MKGNDKKIVITPKKKLVTNNENITIDNAKEKESELNDSNGVTNMDNFEQMFEESLTGLNPGELVVGKVANIADDIVFIDVGYKSEGKVSKNEFYDEIKPGDDVQVMIIGMEDREGNIILSKKKADMIHSKSLIEQCAKDGTSLQGKIVREIKGGFTVDVKGVDAFLPASQVDIRRSNSLGDYVGNKYDFKIAKYEPKKNNIILSRKAYLEEIREKHQKAFLKETKEGDIIKGTIKSVFDYGAFIELQNGVIDGFLHLKDVSWNHIKNCHELLLKGEELETVILKVNQEQSKIHLGLKQMFEDPWLIFVKNHNVDETVQGEVSKFANFGAFIKVTDGVEGLLHINELSWTKKVNHPKDVLKIGDRIQTKILEIDKENRKLSLGLKQILPNPWDSIADDYPKGKKVTGKIKSVTNFGVFVELEDNLVGLLHSNDIDWTKNLNDLKHEGIIQKGKNIDVIILGTNPNERTISLGLKQLLDNPWEIFKANHPRGSAVKGEIVKVLDHGIVIDVGDNLEGFLHASEMIKKREQEISSIYTVGEKIDAAILRIDVKKTQISLSVKEHQRQQEKKTLAEYAKDSDSKKVTLGDLIDFNKLQK